MKTTYLFLAVFLVFSFYAVPANGQIKLETGAKYETRTEIETESVLIYMDEKIDTETNQNTHTETTVEGMNDGLYELAIRTTFIQADFKQMGQEYSFDSTNEEDLNNPVWAEMLEILNTKTTMKMNGKGVVQDISDGYDLQNMGDDSGMFLILPEGLSPGYSWTETTDAENLKTEITYIVREITDTTVVLSTSGTIDMTQIGDADGAETITHSVGTFTGETRVKKSTYLILESTRLMDMEVTVEMVGEKMPASTTTRIKVTNRKL